jgi:hypothetical protein
MSWIVLRSARAQHLERNVFFLLREVSEVQFVTGSSLFSFLSILCLVIVTPPDAEREENDESDESVTNPESSTTRNNERRRRVKQS